MATFVKSGESKTTEEDSSGVRFVKAGSYQAPPMNTKSPFWSTPLYGDGTVASLAATRPGQPDQKVGYGEVAKIAGRTGNELAAAATGTIPELAAQAAVSAYDAARAPQAFPGMTPDQFQQMTAARQAQTPTQNPLAGAGAAAREAFGLNIPELQPNPALSPENTPYMDFSGQTPIRNKILRLTGETAGMVPIGAEIAAGSALAGPLGGGAMAGLAMGAEKFQQGLDAGKSRQEALNEAALSGVGNTALFAIPVAASIAKFLPPTLASRLLTVGVSGLEMGGKMMATGGVDAATNIDNIPMSSEEWKKAYEDVRDGTWNNRSQFLAGALTGAAFGTMTPIGRAKAQAEAKAALDDFIDLGDATVRQREASKEQIGRSGNGLDTQRNPMGRDSGVRFQQQKALPGPALTGPEPQGAITGPDGRPVLAQPRAVGPLDANPVFDPNRQVMPQPEVDALINSLNEQLQARGQRLSVEPIPGGQGALGLPPGAERGPMPDPPPAIPLPPPMGVGRPIEEAPSRRAVAETAPVPAGPAVRPPTPEELALEQQILGADLVDSRDIPKPAVEVRKPAPPLIEARPVLDVGRPVEEQAPEPQTAREKFLARVSVRAQDRPRPTNRIPEQMPPVDVRATVRDKKAKIEERRNIESITKIDSIIDSIAPPANANVRSGANDLRRTIYDTLGIEPPATPDPVTGLVPEDDVLVRIGTSRLGETQGKNIDSPKVLEAVTKAIVRRNADAQGVDADRVLGPESPLTDAGKQKLVEDAKVEAQSVIDTLATELTGQPSKPDTITDLMSARRAPSSAATLDKELIAMQRDGELVLNRNDDPQDITARDEAAKLDLNGERRDLVYLTPQKPVKIYTEDGSIITKSARNPGKFQVTHFTDKGVPAGHEEYDTLFSAIKENPVKDPLMEMPKNGSDDIVRAAVELEDLGNTLGAYGYSSPNRPLGMMSSAGRLGTSTNIDNQRGVVFTDSALSREQMEANQLFPITKEARDAAIKEFVDAKYGPVDTPTPTPQKPTTQEKVQALKDRVEEKKAEVSVYSPETQAIVKAYGGREEALAVLNRQRESLRGNEKVSPQTLAAIEELTGGKKTGQADMFGQGDMQPAPKADLPGQTRLPSSNVKLKAEETAEYITLPEDPELADFRNRVKELGVAPGGRLTFEDLGYATTIDKKTGKRVPGKNKPPWMRLSGKYTVDQWLEFAEEAKLIPSAKTATAEDIKKLMSGSNEKKIQVSPDQGLYLPGWEGTATKEARSIGDIMKSMGLTEETTPKEKMKARAAKAKAPSKWLGGIDIEKAAPTSAPEQATAKVPRKITVNKILAGVPKDIIAYDSKTNTISFDASDAGITKVQQAMDKALDSVPQTPTAQAKYEEAYGEIMDAVFSKQEDAVTPSSKSKNSKKRGADPTNPEAGVRLRMTSKDFRDGIKEIGRLLMAGAKSKPTIRFTKGLPEYVWDEAIKMHGLATSYTTRMQQAAADLIQGYRKSLGMQGLGKDIPKEMRELGTQYLEERSPAAKQALLRQFPEEMHAPLRRMRALIDEMTEEWIRNDVVSPAKAQTLKANKGAYVTRQYQTFNDPNYSNVIPSLVRERMRGLLRQWYPEIKNDDVLEGLVNEWVDVSEGEGSGLMWRGSPLGARNFDILKKRENWPQEVLDLWGLEKDVIKNALNTSVKQAKPLAATIFQHNVVKHGRENNYLFSREDIADINSGKAPKAKAEVYGKLVANNNGTWMTEAAESNKPGASPYASLGVLGDMYASKDFKKAMHDAMNPTQHVEAIKALIQLNGIAKQALTIESLTTQATNFITNPGFFMGSGLALYDMPGLPGRMKIAAGITMTELKNTSAKSYRDVANRAIQLGVIKEMDNASDISKVVEEGKGGPLSKPAIKLAQAGQRLAHEQKNKAKLALGKAAQLPKYLQDMAAEGRDELVAFYQAGDDFWKALSWLTDTEYQMERNPSLSRAQAEELSAKMIRTYGVPYYSELPSVIQRTRHIPVFNPFGSFPTEAPRILFNQTMQAKGEVFSGNAAETKMAARRFAGQAMAYGIPILTATVSAAMWALSDKDQDTLNDMGPQWDSNSNKAYYAVDRSKGIVKYWNISRASVQSEITDPINALLREEKLSEGTQRALLAVLDPYLQEEIGWKALRQIFENRDDYGRPIWNDADTKSEFAKKIGGVAMGAVQPGTVDSIYRILKDDTPVTKLLAEATGQRIRTVDMPKELTYKAKEFMASTRDASMDVKRAEKSGDNAELAEQKRQRLALHKEKWESLHENVSGMKAFRVDYMRIVAALKSGGMSKKNIDNLINGVYLPPESMQ